MVGGQHRIGGLLGLFGRKAQADQSLDHGTAHRVAVGRECAAGGCHPNLVA